MPTFPHVRFDNMNLCITSAEKVRRGIKIRTIPLLITPRVRRMWIFHPPFWCTTTSDLGQWGCNSRKQASSCPGHIIEMPQTEHNAASMQSFNHALSTLDSASAMSLLAAPQSSKKLSLTTVVGWRSILSNAVSSAPALERWSEGASSKGGGRGCILQHGIVFYFFLRCRSFFWERGREKWGREQNCWCTLEFLGCPPLEYVIFWRGWPESKKLLVWNIINPTTTPWRILPGLSYDTLFLPIEPV